MELKIFRNGKGNFLKWKISAPTYGSLKRDMYSVQYVLSFKVPTSYNDVHSTLQCKYVYKSVFRTGCQV